MVKKDPIPCTREEMNNIIEASIGDDFCYTLFKVAVKTGRRLGEYYDVKVCDVDFDRKVMITKVLKKRKRVEKEALLSEEILHLLKRYIRQNSLKLDDYLFRKYSYRTIQNKIKFYAKKANVPHNVSFHNFRHYFITELFKKGLTYDKIAKLTAHTSVSTLSNYDHTVASDIAEETRGMIDEL